jgi:hypothetical protein
MCVALQSLHRRRISHLIYSEATKPGTILDIENASNSAHPLGAPSSSSAFWKMADDKRLSDAELELGVPR